MLAGALGAITRYTLDRGIMSRVSLDFPLGTLVINLSGSLILGFLAGLTVLKALPTSASIILGDGFVGAYTTFSTLTYESLALAQNGRYAAAIGNYLGTIVFGTFFATIGLALGRSI